jgi:hypothetical protein
VSVSTRRSRLLRIGAGRRRALALSSATSSAASFSLSRISQRYRTVQLDLVQDGFQHVAGYMRRQVALAGLAGLGQDLSHPVGRERPGDHAEPDVVAEADAGGQADRNTGHCCRSRKSRPAA